MCKSSRNSLRFTLGGNDIGEFFGYRNDEESVGNGAIKKRMRLEEDANRWLEQWLEHGDD